MGAGVDAHGLQGFVGQTAERRRCPGVEAEDVGADGRRQRTDHLDLSARVRLVQPFDTLAEMKPVEPVHQSWRPPGPDKSLRDVSVHATQRRDFHDATARVAEHGAQSSADGAAQRVVRRQPLEEIEVVGPRQS